MSKAVHFISVKNNTYINQPEHYDHADQSESINVMSQ